MQPKKSTSQLYNQGFQLNYWMFWFLFLLTCLLVLLSIYLFHLGAIEDRSFQPINKPYWLDGKDLLWMIFLPTTLLYCSRRFLNRLQQSTTILQLCKWVSLLISKIAFLQNLRIAFIKLISRLILLWSKFLEEHLVGKDLFCSNKFLKLLELE